MEPPRCSLALLPTPLVRLERLSGGLRGAELWMKRDDLTGLELSGNKVRKLEYIAAEALAAGCRTLITEGTAQSNHCRATAAVCARLGLRCILLLRPPPEGSPQGNHLLDRLLGAECRPCTRAELQSRRDEIVAGLLEEEAREGRRARWIPMGASEPLGCWGYVRALAELAQQLAQAGVSGADVFLPVSSGGTYAGALLGIKLHRLTHLDVWAIPVSDDAAYHAKTVTELAQAAIHQFGLPIRITPEDGRYIEGYVGDGYAIPYEAALEALRELARLEAILLDPVYTAKAFCALLDGIRAGHFGRRRPAVFIHTGGIFSDFAWPESLLGPLT